MTIKKICIPMKTRAEGGGNYMIDNFRRYLDKQGIAHTRDVRDEYDVLFTNSWNQDYHVVIDGLRHNPEARIVHRADGVAWDYGRRDNADKLHARVARLADAVIYQSQYCYDTQREQYKLIEQDGPIIWNAADLEVFNPTREQTNLDGTIRVAYSKFSTNPYKGAAQLYTVAEANPDIDFYLCGRYKDPPNLANIHLMGLLNREELARTLRSCHMLLAFFRNEPCSNVIIEAMSSGLPVLYLDSGSNKELVQEAGLAVTTETFRAGVEQVMMDYDKVSQQARARAEQHFRFDVNLQRYVETIEEALENPLRIGVRERRRLVMQSQLSRPFERAWAGTERFRRRVRGKLRMILGGGNNR